LSPSLPRDPDAGWLEREGLRLVDFARGSVNPCGGFAWLDDEGRPDGSRGMHTWITARMTHVFSLASLRGVPGADGLAAHGVHGLCGPLRDDENGGWFAAVRADGADVVDGSKHAYAHAFVALAASSASAAGVDGGRELLDDALGVLRTRFLDSAGKVVDTYPRDFTEPDPYRGANSSMHMVEALLAVADVVPDPGEHRDLLALARGIAEHLVHGVAREHGYRLPEHYDSDWTPLLEYGASAPGDPFRPYGITPGHLLEWSRLLLNLEAALAPARQQAPPWLLHDARALFAAAVRTGWAVDGEPGFVYTVDWQDRPIVRTRMHWVVAEAVVAAAALARRTGEEEYARWYRVWWEYARTFLVDAQRGSWHHELDASNQPSATVWAGKPDVYHAYQATLLPVLELAPSAAAQLRDARAARS
jgi:sulfoquinovose isomerase